MRQLCLAVPCVAWMAVGCGSSPSGPAEPTAQTAQAVTVSWGGAASTLQCAITSNLACTDDLSGADLGIPVFDGTRTWVLFGDTNGSDASSWLRNADATGYFSGSDPAGICGLGLVTVAGLAGQTCPSGAVFAPDPVFQPTAWSQPIGDFVFQPNALPPAAAAGALPAGAAIPGSFEVPTGAFGYQGRVYAFYSGAPHIDPTTNQPIPSVSYLTSWAPSTTVGMPFTAAASRQIVSKVDFNVEAQNGYPAPAPPSALWGTTPPMGGHFIQVSPVVARDGFLYLFGTGKYRNSHVYLARLALPPSGSPLSLPEYLATAGGGAQYWTGTGTQPWSSAPTDAQALAFGDDPAEDAGELSVQYFPPQGVWMMLYKPKVAPPANGQVVMRWATSAGGPWSSKAVIYDAAAAGAPVQAPYAPYLMPVLKAVPGTSTTYAASFTLSTLIPNVAYGTSLMTFDVDIASPSLPTDDPNWAPALSPDAIPLGTDDNGMPLYACRAVVGSAIVPGKTRSDWSSCLVGSSGMPLAVAPYQTLVPAWVTATGGVIPAGAIPLGSENGEPLYVCRALLPGTSSYQVGKVRTEFGACAYPYGGVERWAPSFEVLTAPNGFAVTESAAQPYGTPTLPYGAMPMGTDSGGALLYSCTGQYFGTQPGKTRSDWGSCDISYAGAEMWLTTPYQVTIARFTAGAANSPYAAGFDSTGVLGICSASYGVGVQVGRYVASTQQCRFAYGASDVALSTGFSVFGGSPVLGRRVGGIVGGGSTGGGASLQ